MEERVGSGREEMGDGGVGNGRERGRGAGGEKDQDADLKADSKSQEGLVGQLDAKDVDSTQAGECYSESEEGIAVFDSPQGNVDGEECDPISEDYESEDWDVKSQESCHRSDFHSEEDVTWGEYYSLSEDCVSQHCDVKSQKVYHRFDLHSEEDVGPRESYSISQDCDSQHRDIKSQEDCCGFDFRCEQC